MCNTFVVKLVAPLFPIADEIRCKKTRAQPPSFSRMFVLALTKGLIYLHCLSRPPISLQSPKALFVRLVRDPSRTETLGLQLVSSSSHQILHFFFKQLQPKF